MTKILRANPMAKGLIFDLDGTLIDSMPLHWEAWRVVCRQHGIDLDRDFFFSQAGKASERISKIIVDHYHSEVDPILIRSQKEQYVLERLSEVEPIEAVVRVVRDNDGRLPMSVGTGSNRERALLMLDNAGLTGYFKAIVCSDDVVNHKPSPDTFVRCAELMGVAPADCEVFEDGVPGFEAARAAGMMLTDVRPYCDATR